MTAALIGAVVVIVGGLQANGMWGKLGPMTSVKGVITSGFALTALLLVVVLALG